MRHRWIITLLVCLFLLGEGAVVIFLPQVVHYNRSSEVYKKYCQTDGVDATFIKDYQVNDTLTLSVTILKANDSATFGILLTDFDIHDLTAEDMKAIESGEDILAIQRVPKCLPPDAPQNLPDDLIAVSRLHKTINVFHVTSRDQYYPLIFYTYRDIMNN